MRGLLIILFQFSRDLRWRVLTAAMSEGDVGPRVDAYLDSLPITIKFGHNKIPKSDGLDIFYFSKIFFRCLHNSQFECVN